MKAPAVFTVVGRNDEVPGTFTLELQAADNSPPAGFAPGQFNMLYAFGAGEVPISFSGDTARRERYIHTIRAVGKTTGMLQRLHQGGQLGVRGPFGRGWPLRELQGKHILVIAGGLGLAPLRPLVYHLLRIQQDLQGMQLFYGSRNPQSLLYGEELQRWQRQFPLHLSVDQAGPGWVGNIGVITSLLAKAAIQPDNTIACICGPEIMMRFSIRTLLGLGMTGESIYLSMERNMHCAVGHCGHCQWGPNFICKDGPVFRLADIEPWFYRREL